MVIKSWDFIKGGFLGCLNIDENYPDRDITYQCMESKEHSQVVPGKYSHMMNFQLVYEYITREDQRVSECKL